MENLIWKVMFLSYRKEMFPALILNTYWRMKIAKYQSEKKIQVSFNISALRSEQD